jgi:Flp pilus assembly protein TadB
LRHCAPLGFFRLPIFASTIQTQTQTQTQTQGADEHAQDFIVVFYIYTILLYFVMADWLVLPLHSNPLVAHQERA